MSIFTEFVKASKCHDNCTPDVDDSNCDEKRNEPACFTEEESTMAEEEEVSSGGSDVALGQQSTTGI